MTRNNIDEEETMSTCKAICWLISALVFLGVISGGFMIIGALLCSEHHEIDGSLYYTDQSELAPRNHCKIMWRGWSELRWVDFDGLAQTVHFNEQQNRKTTLVTSEQHVMPLIVAYYMAYHCVSLETALEHFNEKPWTISCYQLDQLKYWSKRMVCV